MRLDPKEKLYNQPVLKIREVIRHAMQEKFLERTTALIIKEISKILLQPSAICKQIMDELIKDEYLILNKVQKASELLNDLIERAKAINANDELVYIVERIKVFGSYLSGKELLGDLDVAVKITRRYLGEDFTKQNLICKQRNKGLFNRSDMLSFYGSALLFLYKINFQYILKVRKLSYLCVIKYTNETH